MWRWCYVWLAPFILVSDDWNVCSCGAKNKTNKKKTNSDDEDVILQDVSKQLVCSHSSPASSSSHILTRLLSLHPLLFLKEADCKQHLSELGALDGRVTFSREFNNLQICTRVYICLAQMRLTHEAIKRKMPGDVFIQVFATGGESRWVGDGVRLIRSAGWPSFLATFPPSALMRCILTVTFTGLFS